MDNICNPREEIQKYAGKAMPELVMYNIYDQAKETDPEVFKFINGVFKTRKAEAQKNNLKPSEIEIIISPKTAKKYLPTDGLQGSWHSPDSIEYEALDECGRLKPGYRYKKGGKIVKVETKKRKAAATGKKSGTAEKQNRSSTAKKTGAISKPKQTEKSKKTTTPAEKMPLIVYYPIEQINIDEARFQNRTQLNENTVQNIVDDFKETQLDPLIVWTDPKNEKVYLLAGHHRLEALKRMNRENAPVKFADKEYSTEKDAIKYARQLSNANRTLEAPHERAKIYREMEAAGESAKSIDNAAKIEGKNKRYILNLAALNENGPVISAVERLANTPDKQNEKQIEKMADWIGEARKKYDIITDSHEAEMFKFLSDSNASKRIKTKADFLQKIHAIAGAFDFDYDSPLNLARIKYQSEGEKVYDQEVRNLKNEISERQDAITEIKERFTDSNRTDYVSPDAKDYTRVKKRADSRISQINTEIRSLQRELLTLQRNKSKYTKAGNNQGALFGAKSKKKNSPGLKGTEEQPNTNGAANSYSGESKAAPVSVKKSTSKKFGFKSASQVPEKPENVYRLEGEIGDFIQDIQPFQELIIVKGPPHSSKSQLVMQISNAFGETGRKVAYIDGEQGGMAAKDTVDSLNRNTTAKGRENVDVTGHLENPFNDLKEITKFYDVIAADSVTELGISAEQLSQLRSEEPGTIWIFISQVKENGRMYGGNKMAHTPTKIIECHADKDFEKRYATLEKNRGNSLEPVYSIFKKKCIDVAENTDTSEKQNGSSNAKKSDTGEPAKTPVNLKYTFD